MIEMVSTVNKNARSSSQLLLLKSPLSSSTVVQFQPIKSNMFQDDNRQAIGLESSDTFWGSSKKYFQNDATKTFHEHIILWKILYK